jgi:hypothetical protein
MKKQVVITQDELKPITKEVLAKSIVDISAALHQLRQSGLNRRAVVVLVRHITGLSSGTVNAVLDSLENLKHDYLLDKSFNRVQSHGTGVAR